MNLNKLTEKAQEAVLDRAEPGDASMNHAEVDARASAGRARRAVGRHRAVDPAEAERSIPARVAAEARALLKAMPQAYGADVRLSPRMKLIFDSAQAEAQAAAGRVRQHRAPASSRSPPKPGAPPPRSCCSGCGVTKDALYTALTQVRGNQRVTSQNPGVDLRGARPLRPRPHRAGAQGQARSGDRPRRRSPPRHPGAVAPHEEQPGADRRARRRQDRHRRRPGAADRARRRARRAEEQEDLRARHGRAGRRRQVSRRVRGAAEGRAQGDRRIRGADRPLHRRAAHRRRRRRRRRRDGRVADAEADAGARRAAHDRRHDARRVPQAHREGRRARAPLPAGARRRADRRGHDLDPARPARALRDSPQGDDSRTPRWWRPRCCRIATSPIGSCPTRRSTWWTRRRRSCAWRSTRCRRSSTKCAAASCSSRSSARRCARRPTRRRRSGWPSSRRSWPTSRKKQTRLQAQWQQEKDDDQRHAAI